MEKDRSRSKNRNANTHESADTILEGSGKSKYLGTNLDRLEALISSQTSVGFFKENTIIKNIIGDKFDEFQQQCQNKNMESKVWLTALIIAFIEKSFPKEKDVWELIIEKARSWIGDTDIILKAHKLLDMDHKLETNQ